MIDFIVYGLPFTENYGGILVLYELAKTIKDLGYSVKIYASEQNLNPIFNDYYNHDKNNKLSDTTFVIYPEIIDGNPLGAKRVIRWLLCKIGIHTNKDIINTWADTDLIYFYSPFDTKLKDKLNDTVCTTSILNSPDVGLKLNVGCTFPYMYVYYNDPLMINDPSVKRNETKTCFTYRKALKFNNTPIEKIHEPNSMEIKYIFNHKMQKLYFSICTRFYCYDHYTGLVLNAIKCGCIAIIPKIEGVSEIEYLKSGAFGYADMRVPGLAYGIEEIPWAESSKDDIHIYIDKLIKNGVYSVNNVLTSLMNTKYEEMPNTLTKLKFILN